jgi:hypothetical protein
VSYEAILLTIAVIVAGIIFLLLAWAAWWKILEWLKNE